MPPPLLEVLEVLEVLEAEPEPGSVTAAQTSARSRPEFASYLASGLPRPSWLVLLTSQLISSSENSRGMSESCHLLSLSEPGPVQCPVYLRFCAILIILITYNFRLRKKVSRIL